MPRQRKRTTQIASWSVEKMSQALEAIRNGTSIRLASKQYGVPYSSIRDRLRTGICTAPKLGRSTIFTPVQEEEIATHVLLLSKLFYGVSQIELRRVVYEFAEKNKINHRFNRIAKMAGADWMYGFLKRNPNLSLRKPEATSVNRVKAFNRDEVNRFFSNLESLMERHKFLPARIFNVDETGISTVQNPCNILAQKGQKQVGVVTSWERGKNHTICCAISASGVFIPPMFIYPRQRMTPLLERGGPPGSIYRCSKSGWMTEELFMEWLKHFKVAVHTSIEEPVLLILDNHSSHTSLNTYQFCKENGIHMLSLPPHTSHRMQPLDVTVFGPLKAALSREMDIFIKSRQYLQITPYDLASLFNKAYARIATVEKAVNGFEVTGIHPFNPNVFNDEDFLASDSLRDPDDPEVVHAAQERNETSPVPVVGLEETNKTPPALNATDNSNQNISFTKILPIPGPSTYQKRPARRKQHSEILTSTPFKDVFEEKEKRRANKTSKLIKKSAPVNKRTKAVVSNTKRAAVKRKICEEDSSTSSSHESIDDSNLCDDDELDDADPNEFCIICNEFGKDGEMWYRCTMCGKWVHQECSGCLKAKKYICDFCRV